MYDLKLPEDQIQLVQTAQKTGKPVILIMIAGRPRTITEIYDGCDAVIWAGLPGFEGGTAIAELIRGEFSPSGKLPFSYPAYDGHFYTYDHKLMDKNHYAGLSDEKTVLEYFGHGLSYTTFAYEDLVLSDSVIGDHEILYASVEVKNTGNALGKETLLWYMEDEVAKITRPVKKLCHFEVIELAPGESRTVSFRILPREHLAYVNDKGEKILEEGYFRLSIGTFEKRFLYKSYTQ